MAITPKSAFIGLMRGHTTSLSDSDPEDINCFTLYEWQQAEQLFDSFALTDEQLASIIFGLTL